MSNSNQDEEDAQVLFEDESEDEKNTDEKDSDDEEDVEEDNNVLDVEQVDANMGEKKEVSTKIHYVMNDLINPKNYLVINNSSLFPFGMLSNNYISPIEYAYTTEISYKNNTMVYSSVTNAVLTSILPNNYIYGKNMIANSMPDNHIHDKFIQTYNYSKLLYIKEAISNWIKHSSVPNSQFTDISDYDQVDIFIFLSNPFKSDVVDKISYNKELGEFLANELSTDYKVKYKQTREKQDEKIEEQKYNILFVYAFIKNKLMSSDKPGLVFDEYKTKTFDELHDIAKKSKFQYYDKESALNLKNLSFDLGYLVKYPNKIIEIVMYKHCKEITESHKTNTLQNKLMDKTGGDMSMCKSIIKSLDDKHALERTTDKMYQLSPQEHKISDTVVGVPLKYKEYLKEVGNMLDELFPKTDKSVKGTKDTNMIKKYKPTEKDDGKQEVVYSKKKVDSTTDRKKLNVFEYMTRDQKVTIDNVLFTNLRQYIISFLVSKLGHVILRGKIQRGKPMFVIDNMMYLLTEERNSMELLYDYYSTVFLTIKFSSARSSEPFLQLLKLSEDYKLVWSGDKLLGVGNSVGKKLQYLRSNLVVNDSLPYITHPFMNKFIQIQIQSYMHVITTIENCVDDEEVNIEQVMTGLFKMPDTLTVHGTHIKSPNNELEKYLRFYIDLITQKNPDSIMNTIKMVMKGIILTQKQQCSVSDAFRYIEKSLEKIISDQDCREKAAIAILTNSDVEDVTEKKLSAHNLPQNIDLYTVNKFYLTSKIPQMKAIKPKIIREADSSNTKLVNKNQRQPPNFKRSLDRLYYDRFMNKPNFVGPIPENVTGTTKKLYPLAMQMRDAFTGRGYLKDETLVQKFASKLKIDPQKARKILQLSNDSFQDTEENLCMFFDEETDEVCMLPLEGYDTLCKKHMKESNLYNTQGEREIKRKIKEMTTQKKTGVNKFAVDANEDDVEPIRKTIPIKKSVKNVSIKFPVEEKNNSVRLESYNKKFSGMGNEQELNEILLRDMEEDAIKKKSTKTRKQVYKEKLEKLSEIRKIMDKKKNNPYITFLKYNAIKMYLDQMYKNKVKYELTDIQSYDIIHDFQEDSHILDKDILYDEICDIAEKKGKPCKKENIEKLFVTYTGDNMHLLFQKLYETKINPDYDSTEDIQPFEDILIQ